MKIQNSGTRGGIRIEKTLIVLLLVWAITGPCFSIGDLPDGEWDIINDEYGEVVRVNLNKIKDWSKVPGIKMRWEVTGPNGKSYAEHAVISEIMDVDGDGKLDLFRVCDGVVMRFDENNNRLWKSTQLNPSADDESRMPVRDLDGDGYDEVFFPLNKKTMAVSHDGHILWEDNTQDNHSDWICAGDIDNDGVTELVYDHDGCWAAGGPINVVNGTTGDREQSWEYNWPSDHDSNAATLGDFRPDLPGLELARVDKMNSGLGVKMPATRMWPPGKRSLICENK